MDTKNLFKKQVSKKALGIFIVLLGLTIAFIYLASLIQSDFGKISVKSVWYKNYNGLDIRAKIMKPSNIQPGELLPGIVYAHGHQSCRETSDPYCMELARRGFIVLNIDVIGRGNSDTDLNDSSPNYDKSCGIKSSIEYLKNLENVDKNAIGLMGHSLGANMSYNIALKNPDIKALVITGFAYQDDVTKTMPKNMLMIFGKWDEYRKRMTKTGSFVKEWMKSSRTEKAFPVSNPEFNKTYGDFDRGTARKVISPACLHNFESHNFEGIKESVLWMKSALKPDEKYWISADKQIWDYKEWLSLLALITSFASLIPLALFLLNMKFFSSLQTKNPNQYEYTVKKSSYIKGTLNNIWIMLLYIPSIMVIFGIHKYVVRIDHIFPLMVVLALAWWMLVTNFIGFLFFKKWFKKRGSEETSLYKLGISLNEKGFSLNSRIIGKTILLSIILFGVIYLIEYLLEHLFLVDFRFIYSFANDLTPYRALLFMEFLPFFLIAFILNGIFIHAQMRLPKKDKWWKTFIISSFSNVLIMIIPLIIHLFIQYLPMFTADIIPLSGPGGVFVFFIINIFHIIGVLILVIPISTWFYQLTGNIYLGAFTNAMLVTWMLVASQVIAPVPV